MRRAAGITLAIGLTFARRGEAAAEPSRLALPAIAFETQASADPRLILAQRAIDREWTTPEDTAGVARDPGAFSELGAMGLSAAFPGAGQQYAGEPTAVLFAAAEVAGWVSWAWLQRDARRLRDQASEMAGAPGDSASHWSFDRWQTATGGDDAALRALYLGDREAFFDAIAADNRYAAGWNDPDERILFRDRRHGSDRRLDAARWASTGIWVNHLIAAVEAMRAARLRNVNVALGHGTQLMARGRWHEGRPGLTLALQRRF